MRREYVNFTAPPSRVIGVAIEEEYRTITQNQVELMRSWPGSYKRSIPTVGAEIFTTVPVRRIISM